MRPLNKALLLTAAVLVVLQLSVVAFAQDPAREHIPLNIGFNRTSFLAVNISDAKAAFKVFAQSVGRKKGYDLDVTVRAFENTDDFINAAKQQALHVAIMLAWDYLDANLQSHLEPRFLSFEAGQGPREYLILVKSDLPYKHIRDLKGKRVLILENTNCEMSRNWLKTLLLAEGFGLPSAFFSEAVVKNKPAKVLLPVFFGQVSACVINRPVFDMMRELNPQIGRRLRSIAVSKPLVDAITYVALNGWIKPAHREDLIEALGTLHEEPQGKQILTLFKADRLAPFDDGCMAGTVDLKNKHDKLLRKERSP